MGADCGDSHRGHHVKHQIALFRFTLSPHQSIGPAQLQALWATACRTPNVSVGRDRGPSGGPPTYALYASQHLDDMPMVEQRLRRLLDECKLRASVIPVHAL